jgi:ribosome-associated protein
MDIRKLQRAIVDGLEDVKGQNIVVFNTEHLSSLFERVIIASGTSNRQTKSLASSVRESVKSAGFPVPRLEGEDNGEWIIVDCGAAVAHVMQPAIRDYYHLEEIWGDKPVKMKIDGANAKAAQPKSVRSETTSVRAKATPVRAKATSVRAEATSVRAEVSKPRARPSAPQGERSAARKPAAKAGVTRVVGVKKAIAKTSATKAPAKKAPAKKTSAAKKAPAARKTAARG